MYSILVCFMIRYLIPLTSSFRHDKQAKVYVQTLYIIIYKHFLSASKTLCTACTYQLSSMNSTCAQVSNTCCFFYICIYIIIREARYHCFYLVILFKNSTEYIGINLYYRSVIVKPPRRYFTCKYEMYTLLFMYEMRYPSFSIH